MLLQPVAVTLLVVGVLEALVLPCLVSGSPGSASYRVMPVDCHILRALGEASLDQLRPSVQRLQTFAGAGP